jgi:IMP dehydrogenase/GMP reductase
MKISKKISLNFNDVHLLSDAPSVVSSRSEVLVPMERIIMAPMHSIQGTDLITAAVQSGISVPIHRFNTVSEQKELLSQAVKIKKLLNTKSELWISVGMNDYKERILANRDSLFINNVGVLLDVANGFSYDVEKVLQDIRRLVGDDLSLFAGNVHTWSGFSFLETYCNLIRVGIGPGEACLTTANTGIGRGQLTVIDEIAENQKHAAVVADGGIRGSGDLAKAFGVGADYVMIGGLFKHASEALCVQNNTTFFGGASAKAKQSVGLPVKHVEGTEINIDREQIKPLGKILDELVDGLKSAIAYSGYSSLQTFIGNGKFEAKV